MDDALTVGQSLMVPLAYEGEEFEIRMLFGIKKSDLWIEAIPDNLDIVAKCLKSDFDNGNFATTRPRGKYFRHASTGDEDDVDVHGNDADAGNGNA